MTHPNTGPTLDDVKTYARNQIRAYLGVDRIPHLEAAMATAKEQIDQLSTKIDTLGTVVGDVHNDFTAFRDAMTVERENLTAAGQAALDEANAKADATAARLADLDVEIGDADGSDTIPANPTA